MTQQDLNSLNVFKERFDKLPKTADLWLKSQSDESTEKEDIKKVWKEIDDLLDDIQFFCKVKFKDDEQHLNACRRITFEPNTMGIPFVSTYAGDYEKSWKAGIYKLDVLIKNMIREVKLRIEDKPQTIEVESSPNSVLIKNSTVVMGDVAHSDLSRNRNNDNNAPTKKWQIITVVVAILIAIIRLLLDYCKII